MSISGAINAAISGLRAQASAIAMIADNVANASTPGYKATESRFQTMVTQSSAQANMHSPGGVINQPYFANQAQGGITQTGSPTSVAIAGAGFLTVSKAIGENSATGEPIFEATDYFTRVGDFTQNAQGYLVNSAGYYLQAWAIDQSTGEVDTSWLTEVRVSDLLEAPVPTSLVDYAANLPSEVLGTNGSLPAELPASSIQVYDALGNEHTVSLSWTRIGVGSWTLEVEAPGSTPATLGPATVEFGGSLGLGPVAAGTISALATAGGLTAAPAGVNNDASFSFNLDFGSGNQAIRLDLGAYGNTTGTTQFASDTLTLNDFRQNGVPQGDFKSLAIDESGAVVVTYDNGNVRKLYQLPIATFANPDELDRVDGNAFVATPGSGAAVFKFPGGSGAGDLVSAAIEGSNVDIAAEFAKLIVAQRVYSANARILTAADELLQEIINIRR
jgi:flagellar hook protein FlgE